MVARAYYGKNQEMTLRKDDTGEKDVEKQKKNEKENGKKIGKLFSETHIGIGKSPKRALNVEQNEKNDETWRKLEGGGWGGDLEKHSEKKTKTIFQNSTQNRRRAEAARENEERRKIAAKETLNRRSCLLIVW